MKTLITSLLAATACGSSAPPPAVPSVRFVNAPPVAVVDDHVSTPKLPSTDRGYLGYFDDTVMRPMLRPLELHAKERAQGVNAIDEVPDSTWFTNRIGARDLTVEELTRGPIKIDNPDLHRPWTIMSIKKSGESLGFIIDDARGERFYVKFDREGFPEMETAAHMITGRFLWAFGYNVTEDYISHVRLTDFVISPDAKLKDPAGHQHAFHKTDFSRLMQRVIIANDGTVRAMTSRVLPGKSLGGHPAEGVRPDDPNDRISHELRRDLRGAAPMYAWLDNEDIKSGNTIDAWVADPKDPNTHYVVHYFLDFGKSLGVMAGLSHDPRPGFEYSVDAAPLWGSFVTLGFMPRPFLERRVPQYRGIGLYDAQTYKPGKWRPYAPSYVPMSKADRLDWFWGAKTMMRFTRDQIRAIVDVGELSDPRAVNYLVDTLITRQRVTAYYAFQRVSTLDRFTVGSGNSLCFDDLMLKYDLSTKPSVYAIRSFDMAGRPLGPERTQAPSGAHTCTASLPVARDGNGYTIVKLTTYRDGDSHAVFVHIAPDPITSDWHVIGVWRE